MMVFWFLESIIYIKFVWFVVWIKVLFFVIIRNIGWYSWLFVVISGYVIRILFILVLIWLILEGFFGIFFILRDWFVEKGIFVVVDVMRNIGCFSCIGYFV